jgi:hypothetical protein
MSDTALRIEYAESLFEQVEEDLGGDRQKFEQILEELCDTEFLEYCVCPSDDNLVLYKAKTGLNWTSLVTLADPIKKKILLQLIENPKCFFVLFNTQKGKLRTIGKEIASWPSQYNKRVVSFLVVDNDRTLSEQSVNGLFDCFPVKQGCENVEDPREKYNVQIFELSSNNKLSLKDVICYIDAYAYNMSYSMPLILVLSNDTQHKKLVQIIDHVLNHPCEKLCIGGAWDEADKVYPLWRTKPVTIRGEEVTFLKLFEHDRMIRNGFVTATEGELLEENYEECANAYHYPVVIDPEDNRNYLAFHHPESKKHNVVVRSQESNNSIAERVLQENWETHFKVPLRLSNGEAYQHKIIINSNAKGEDMKQFALAFRDKANIITFNMRGLNLYLETGEAKKYPSQKQTLNRLLFYIYKMNKLDRRPLIIIGRRKVDRGLGFHYAPRKNSKLVKEIVGKDGTLHTNGIEGLIWTDLILGNKIEHIPTAVQKAGRGAGIIRQCPQYTGEFHYWVDDETAEHILRHYKKVDTVNELAGTNSIYQAVSHATALLPPMIQRNHTVDLNTFRVIQGSSPDHTLQLIKCILQDVLLCGARSYRKPSQDDQGRYKTSLNNESEAVSVIDAVKKVPGAYGTNHGERTYRRFLASYKNLQDNNTLCVVIPLIDPSYTVQMKQNLDTRYANYFLEIPQQGEF